VITVSHSFIATANAVHYCSATPVFIDIEPGARISIPPDRTAITARTGDPGPTSWACPATWPASSRSDAPRHPGH
jgi:hypothetical protein